MFALTDEEVHLIGGGGDGRLGQIGTAYQIGKDIYKGLQWVGQQID